MSSRFMMSVATAALIAGTSFAYAQGMGGREGGAGSGPAAQQSAPAAEHGATTAPSGREGAAPSSGMKATQSEQKSPGAGSNQRAEENMQGQKSNNTRSENNNATGGKDMKAEGREKTDMKAEGRNENKDMKAEGRDNRNGNMNAETRTDSKSQTTGQAGAGAKLSSEQRTKITTVIRNEHVRPVEHVNFSISIGTRVPRDVEFHRLPTEVITYYPEWRGYEYILVNSQILVIDPGTYEIVAVLEA